MIHKLDCQLLNKVKMVLKLSLKNINPLNETFENNPSKLS